MIDRVRRPIDVVASELQVALKRETADIIAIGHLLLEAQEQVEHGEWLEWLDLNFGKSSRTAQNYMGAARFAAKYASVADLKLKASALYWLAGNLDDITPEEIEAILKIAETEWVDDERASEIVDSLQDAEPEEEWREEERRERERARERAEARTEADDILDGPPPELPPAPEPNPIDFTLQSFDQAVGTLVRLRTKPLNSFFDTTHDLEVINRVHGFVAEVADLLQK